jgi:uncharacterized protein
MTYYPRHLTQILKSKMKLNKILIIYGARRIGKTTLCKELVAEHGDKARFVNCENLLERSKLENDSVETIIDSFKDYEVVVFDEAQVIPGIGKILKLIYDTLEFRNQKINIIATGSSSFELSNQIGEPLVGRAFSYQMYPLGLCELRGKLDNTQLLERQENILRFGLMPDIFGRSDNEAIESLYQLVSGYLYKDILAVEGIQKSKLVIAILKALAFQVGSMVSIRELAQIVNSTPITVTKYLDILEKCFIIFPLSSLARNPRNELKRAQKYYFYDIGVRNALVQNFNPLDSRDDIGALWENFCILERMKLLQSKQIYYNQYFWRTLTQKEIDYIEEYDGKLNTFEFKWNPKKEVDIPKDFAEFYPKHTYNVVNSKNWLEFLT